MNTYLKFVALIALCVSFPASAHKPSDSYLNLEVNRETVSGQWDIALQDLDYAIGLDSNGDGNITWGELRRRHGAIEAYVLSHLVIRNHSRPCAVTVQEQIVDYHSDGGYTVLRFDATCPNGTQSLDIDYNLFFDLDPQHRGLVNMHYGDTVQTAILTVDRRSRSFDSTVSNRWAQFRDYVREGVWHIWMGFDHVLFLITLLLPAALRRSQGRWQVSESMRDSLFDVAKIVTSFTIAHSITLSLSAIGVISISSQWVESAIAASVVVVALNNVYPLITSRIWTMAFGFGLVHGMGFATVLKDLGLPDGALFRSLFGFNLGVEAGQLAIVMVLFPIVYLLRDQRLYHRLVLGSGSLLIAAVGAVWFLERAFSMRLWQV